jgi:hypothetical protein
LKAELMQNQIEHQRDNMNQTTRSVAEDEMSLVESEIAAQREMLKEADTTLNNILNKMEDDVVDVSERDPGKNGGLGSINPVIVTKIECANIYCS